MDCSRVTTPPGSRRVGTRCSAPVNPDLMRSRLLTGSAASVLRSLLRDDLLCTAGANGSCGIREPGGTTTVDVTHAFGSPQVLLPA
jgi:hypothetical protein